MCRLGWVLALAIATSSWSSVQAQTPAEPDQERPLVPPELTVAPLAPKFGQEPLPPQAGKPANICQELVAFIEFRANSHTRSTHATIAVRPAGNRQASAFLGSSSSRTVRGNGAQTPAHYTRSSAPSCSRQ